jgi:hypothetical protein
MGKTGRATYKSKVARLENNTFNVGASSNPAKFSIFKKNIESYIKKAKGYSVLFCAAFCKVARVYSTNQQNSHDFLLDVVLLMPCF